MQARMHTRLRSVVDKGRIIDQHNPSAESAERERRLPGSITSFPNPNINLWTISRLLRPVDS